MTKSIEKGQKKEEDQEVHFINYFIFDMKKVLFNVLDNC